MTLHINAQMMDGLVRGALQYLTTAIEHRIEENRGQHLVAAVSLMLGVVAKMHDPLPVVDTANTCLAEAKAPIRVSLTQ